MTENGASNVTQLLKSFQRFLLCYENPLWSKNASVEDIKSTFKLGNFIEKSIQIFKAKEFLPQFFILLELWGKQNNLKTYSQEFFALANDHLLSKLFRFPNVKGATLDIAVRMYTSLYPKERFKECIKNIILASSSLRAVADFVNTSVSDRTFIENNIILVKWSEYCQLGLKDALKLEIESYLSLYNVNERLPRLISLLAIKETMSDQENSVRNFILECVLNKMVDRSPLSKTFWFTLFKKVNLHHISQTCTNYPTFLESLLNFIEYVGGAMKRDNSSEFCEWTSDPSVSFCHEISYLELVIFLKTLCCESIAIKKLVLERLDQAREYSNVWSQIIHDISE